MTWYGAATRDSSAGPKAKPRCDVRGDTVRGLRRDNSYKLRAHQRRRACALQWQRHRHAPTSVHNPPERPPAARPRRAPSVRSRLRADRFARSPSSIAATDSPAILPCRMPPARGSRLARRRRSLPLMAANTSCRARSLRAKGSSFPPRLGHAFRSRSAGQAGRFDVVDG
jgi:hypothetical protein